MKILLADNNILFRESIALLLKSLVTDLSLKQTSNWEEMNQFIEKSLPDLIFLNQKLSGSLSWRYELRHLTTEKTQSPVCLIFSDSTTIDPQTAYQLGVKGSINKDTSVEELAKAISCIKAGKAYFQNHAAETSDSQVTKFVAPKITPRQMEILELLKGGASNKGIGTHLNLSEGTVKQHLNKLFKTLHAKNRVEAIELAMQLGLI